MKHIITKASTFAGAVILLTTFASPAFADNHQDVTKATALINKTFHNKVSVIRSFDAPKNLIGFVIKQSGQQQPSVIYVDKDGSYLFSGSLINSDGKDITGSMVY